MSLEIREPAAFDDCLAAARATPWMRKAALMMRLRCRTWSFHASDGDGDELLAVAYLWPHPNGTAEFCLAARLPARRHMLTLCRFAQLTLQAIAQTGAVVFCHVRPGRLSGERMARLAGFARDPETAGKWVHVWRLPHGGCRQGSFGWRWG